MSLDDRWFSLFPTIIGVAALGVALESDVKLVKYPLYTVTAASLLFVVHEHLPVLSLKDLSPTSTRVFNSGVYLLIGVTAIIGQWGQPGVVDIYYPVAIVTTGVIVYRIARSPVQTSVAISQILLFAMVLRATLWFSYPYYGADLFHFAATGWIVNSGSIVPESITYYSGFPIAHIFAASTTLLTDLPLKNGYFVLGIIQSISLIAVYAFAHRIIRSQRAALFATLFVAVSGYYVKSGGEPFAQALLTSLIPIVLYLLFSDRQLSIWHQSILLGLIAIGIATQNIAPIIFVGVGVMIWSTYRLVGVLAPYIKTDPRFDVSHIPLLLMGLIGYIWYEIANYLHDQVWRIIVIFLRFLRGTSKNQVEATGFGGAPTVTIFGTQLPGVATWAAPLLTSALVIGIANYFSLRKIVYNRTDNLPIQYVIFASLIFAGVGAVFAAGSPDAVRALPAATIIIGPLAGFALDRMGISKGETGAILVCIMLMTVATAGLLSPGIAKPALSEDTYHERIDSSQIAGAEFTMQYAESAWSGPYVRHYDYYSQAAAGKLPDVVIQEAFRSDEEERIRKFQLRADNGETIVYLDYYEFAFNITKPDTNKIYSSGDTSVYT